MATIRKSPAEQAEEVPTFVSAETLEQIAAQFSTPFYLFDESTLRKSIAEIRGAFSPDILHYVPMRVCGNRELLRVIREAGAGVCCNTVAEFQLAVECGFRGEKLRYSSVFLPEKLLSRLRSLGGTLELVHPFSIPDTAPERVDIRCCPPKEKQRARNCNLRYSALGLASSEFAAAVGSLHRRGAETIGLSLPQSESYPREDFLAGKAKILLSIAEEFRDRLGETVTHFDLGTGLTLEYDGDFRQTLCRAGTLLREVMTSCGTDLHASLSLWRQMIESGAVLVTKVIGLYQREELIAVTDVSFRQTTVSYPVNRRPLTVPGKPTAAGRTCYHVLGSAAERCEWLEKDAVLPPLSVGDLLVFRNTGCCIPSESAVPCLMRRETGEIVLITA